MAKTLVLKAQKREQTGTKSAVKIRNEGGIPAIVYGHKQEPGNRPIVSNSAHENYKQLRQGQSQLPLQR